MSGSAGRAVGNAPWGVAELQIYQIEDSVPPAPLRVEALVERLAEHQIERLLADPVASARVDRATGSAVSTPASSPTASWTTTGPRRRTGSRVRSGSAPGTPCSSPSRTRRSCGSAWRPRERASSPSRSAAKRSSGSSRRSVRRALPAAHGARRLPRARGRRKRSPQPARGRAGGGSARLGRSTLASDPSGADGRSGHRVPGRSHLDACRGRTPGSGVGMGGPDALCRVGSPAGGGARPHTGPLRARRRELRRRGSQSSVHPRRHRGRVSR